MDPEAGPPFAIGTPLRAVSLTGKVFPWDPVVGQPMILAMQGTRDLYLACFSEAKDLRTMMTRLKIFAYTMKHIDDGSEFRSSIPSMFGDVLLHLILDPYFHENGRILFTQILGRE